MDRLKLRGIAAVTFFRAGLLMVLFFTFAIALQPQEKWVFPRLLALAGMLPSRPWYLPGDDVQDPLNESITTRTLAETPAARLENGNCRMGYLCDYRFLVSDGCPGNLNG